MALRHAQNEWCADGEGVSAPRLCLAFVSCPDGARTAKGFLQAVPSVCVLSRDSRKRIPSSSREILITRIF